MTPALSEIIVAIIALSLVIGLMVGWCLGAWRNRIVYRDEDNEPADRILIDREGVAYPSTRPVKLKARQ